MGWKSVLLFVFAALSVFAEEPGQILSHEQFVNLPRAHQTIYLKQLQKMLSDIENYQAKKGIFTEALNNRVNIRMNIPIFFSAAYAIEAGGTCIFAGKLKTWEKREKGLFCPSPGPGTSCRPPQIECNPLVFGPGVCTTRNAYATRNCESNSKSFEDVAKYVSDPSRKKEWDDYVKQLNNYCQGINLSVQGPECAIIQYRLGRIDSAIGKPSSLALLSEPEFLEEGSKKVVYFGGYQSSPEQMKCWAEGAKKKNEGYTFQGFAYPSGADSSDESAVKHGQATIRKIVEEINNNPKVKFVIVGHSSGSALANAVAERVKNPEQIQLVTLEGFTPNVYIRKRVKTSCWYAEGANGLLSGSGAEMKKYCGRPQKLSNTTCKTKWCLHFSLVNRSVPESLGNKDYKDKGYEGCDTNLDWLPGAERSNSPGPSGNR